MKKKIYVRGPVLSQSGYGEQARFALRALHSRQDLFDIYIEPIPWGKTNWIWERSEFRSWMDARIFQTKKELINKQLQPDISLQITIPNEFQKLAPINYGYTAGIETNKCSPIWLQKCNEMDKVLVVSKHAKNSIVETIAMAKNNETGEEFPYKCETPFEVVWEKTERSEPVPIKELSLDYDRNFIMVSQLGPRKNFENTISWFVEEFIDQEVGLVIKTNFKGNNITDYGQVERHLKTVLTRYPDRKCKIYLLHGDLSSGQMTWLYSHPSISALINISHGEGFGLPMFEAAREALPIVTIGWSGQVDFLNHNGKDYYQSVDYSLRSIMPQAIWEGVLEKDSMWAYADQGSFKMTLRRTLKNLDKCKETAKELQELIEKNFSNEKLYNGFVKCFFDEEEIMWYEQMNKVSIYE
jgi:glycosyltransferase involved in cell wall biosynthesis